MPWSGSGTFSRETTTVSPATAGTTADSADMNTYTTDVTNGINAARTKNGENAATANLPMGGFKHTNVAAGTARTEYASVAQGQDGSTVYAADTGAADAYVVTLSPAISSNVVGRKTSFKATNANTGASTLNLNIIGAETIKRQNGNDLVANDILADKLYTVVWDGTNYQLTSQYNDLSILTEYCTSTTSFTTDSAVDIPGLAFSNIPVGNYAVDGLLHILNSTNTFNVTWNLTNITTPMMGAQITQDDNPGTNTKTHLDASTSSLSAANQAAGNVDGACSIQGMLTVSNATNSIDFQALLSATPGTIKVYVNSWIRLQRIS